MKNNYQYPQALSFLEYDRAEIDSKMHLSNRVIEAFSPITFNKTGYPIRVEKEAELWRYVDVMHETRAESTVNYLLNGLSSDEFVLFKKVIDFMAEFTMTEFGRLIRCENALLRAFNVYRHIKAVGAKTVFEIGPGSGYLGLLLIFDGLGYVGCDNTQAFYFMQNRLWRAAAKDRFVDLAENNLSLSEVLTAGKFNNCVHVPWWKLIDFDFSSMSSTIDVFTANHCLAEMHENARDYSLKLAYDLIKKNNGAFIFEGWGDNIINSSWTVSFSFVRFGFDLVHSDRCITIFAPKNAVNDSANLPHKPNVGKLIRNMVRRLIGMPIIPYEYSFTNYSSDNFFSTSVKSMRRKISQSKTYTSQDILNYVSKVYGPTLGVEAQFLDLIKRKYE